MNKSELHQAIHDKSDVSKTVIADVVDAFLDVITETLQAGDKVTLVGFGTFEVKQRAARDGRNPQTGKAIKIAASKVPSFKAGKGLKDAVNKV